MSARQKNVLIVPLDWGLGHATRCVPVIEHLLEVGHKVFIGGTLRTNTLLATEFPELTFLSYNGYDIQYPKRGAGFLRNMLLQLPKISKAIKKENLLTQKYCADYGIDLIISDNRFGVYSEKIQSFFITHQINIQMPFTWLTNFVRRINFHFIKKFDQVLIPDYPNQVLSSALSDYSKDLNKPVHWLGILSRLKNEEVPKNNEVLFLLSGPEPQRSLLEEKFVAQAESLKLECILVGGIPDRVYTKESKCVRFINHLNKRELNLLMNQSSVIISRTGYSTIMDLIQMERSAILIPTPGQFEQEFLGEYYAGQGFFDVQTQENFDLKQSLEIHKNRKKNRLPKLDYFLYKKVIAELLSKI